MNLQFLAKFFINISPSMVGDDHLIINAEREDFDKDAIARIYRYDFNVEVENIDNFFIEEVYTFGVNYGTNGNIDNNPFAIRFTCNIKKDITTFSTRIGLKKYILATLKGVTIEDMSYGELSREEIEYLLLNNNLSLEEKAWLKLQ
jgi:hypothetical protein